MPFRGLSALGSSSAEDKEKFTSGKTDLLLRFLQSSFFDEWIAITYLYKSNSQGVQDYLCNRLYGLPEQGIERYLSQLTTLVVQRQSASLDRVLVDLCARSLRIAVKTYWLLLAISQDQPKNKYVADLRDRCEHAALEGYWEPPFRDTKLLPLSPVSGHHLRHGPLSPTVVSPPHSPAPGGVRHLNRSLDLGPGSGFTSHDPSYSVGRPPSLLSLRERYGSPDRGRPLSPDGLGRAMYACHAAVGQRVEQMAYYNTPLSPGGSTAGSPRGSEAASRALSPPPARALSPPVRERQHSRGLHLDLGDGAVSSRDNDGVGGLLSPTNSPRLRQTTYGATLDFVEALCTASSGLTSFAHEDRQWALCRALEAINGEIDVAARNGVAIWSPMGRRNDRVVRLVSNEVAILNSREKAPFLLYIEVLNGDALPEEEDEDEDEEGDDGDGTSPTSATASGGAGAAVERGLAAGAGGASASNAASQQQQQRHGPDGSSSIVRSLDFDVEYASEAAAAAAAAAPSPRQHQNQENELPPGVSGRQQQQQRMADGGTPTAAGGGTAGRPPAAPSSGGGAAGGSGGGGGPPQQPSDGDAALGSGRQPLMAQQVEDSFTLGLKSALAGLRGEGPLVQVSLFVVEQPPSSSSLAGNIGTPGAAQGGDPGAGGEDPGSARSLAHAASPGGTPSARGGGAGGVGGSSREDPYVIQERAVAESSKALGLLSRWGLYRSRDEDPSTSVAQPSSQPQSSTTAPDVGPHLVRLKLQVVGGFDLRIKSSMAKHRRVPSHEALLRMAAQQKTAVGQAAAPAGPAPSRGGGEGSGAAGDMPQPGSSGRGRPHHHHPSGASPVGLSPTAAAAALAAEQQQQQPSHQGGGSAPSSSQQKERSPGPKLDPGSVLQTQHSIAGVVDQLDQSQAAAAQSTMSERQLRNEQLMQRKQEANRVYGERFVRRCERIRTESPHGRRPGWGLRPLIVKTGDDCRQELLAVQLIQTFKDVFAEAALPLWLRPFEVLVTSNRTALIEVIPDCLSIHTVKARSGCTSLRQYLCDKFVEGSPEFHKAQRNFVESMAAYSIVCYLLQIKDRHNGNIMLDDEGHLVHIDFGFMLSNSPGGVNFESAPFKLTRELLEVMDSNSEGQASELFDYFKVLMIQGFLVCRKHADRMLMLVEMMQHSGCPCFKAGSRAMGALRRRFHLNLTDTQCVEMVLSLIADSLDAWRTRQYDYYQRILNGIL